LHISIIDVYSLFICINFKDYVFVIYSFRIFYPLIVVLLGVYYYELDSGETFAEYFRHNESVLLATVVPGQKKKLIAP